MHRRAFITILAGGVSDTTAPTVASFTVTTPSLSLDIPIAAFTASEAGASFLITETSDQPAAGAAGWAASAPATYTVAAQGNYTLYPWVKDSSGNVSSVYATPAAVFVYVPLLLDNFTTDDSAPLGTPRTCEPTGTLVTVETDGQMSISSAKLNFPAQASASWGDQGFRDNASRTRAAGLAVGATINLSTIGGNGMWFGFGTGVSLSYTQIVDRGFNIYTPSGNSLRLIDNGGLRPDFELVPTTGVDYRLVAVLRSAGMFWFIKGGAFTEWTLLYVSNANTANGYPSWSNMSNAGTVDYLKCVNLIAPFTTDNGIATTALTGARSDGDTFTHTANCLIEFTVTTLPSDAVDFRFRQQDATNYWQLLVNANGSLALNVVIAGTPAAKGTAAAGTVTNGARIVIIPEGTKILVFVGDVQKIVQSSATQFPTATAGVLTDEGVDGAISGIIAWPRVLAGTGLTALNSFFP